MRMDAFAEPRNPMPQSHRPPANGQHMVGGGPFPALRGGTLKKNKDWGYWGIDDGRTSISPVDSLMHSEMMAAAEGEREAECGVEDDGSFQGFLEKEDGDEEKTDGEFL